MSDVEAITPFEQRSIWIMMGAECRRTNGDNRYHSRSNFSRFIRLEGESESDVLRQAAEIEAVSHEIKGAFGQGECHYWCGPFLVVKTDNVYDIKDNPDEWTVEYDRDDADSAVQAHPTFRAHADDLARKKAEKEAADHAVQVRRAEQKERSDYERLKAKFGG